MRYKYPNHHHNLAKRFALCAEQFELLDLKRPCRNWTNCRFRTMRIRRKSIGSKFWFTDCCNRCSNTFAHDSDTSKSSRCERVTDWDSVQALLRESTLFANRGIRPLRRKADNTSTTGFFLSLVKKNPNFGYLVRKAHGEGQL